MPAGRPSEYSQEVSDIICSRIATGMSLRKVCLDDDVPTITTFYNWLSKYPELVEQYARAKEDSADADADKLDQIAEGVLVGEYDPASARVAADIIKWSAGKKRPKKYGDRTMIEDITPPSPDKRKSRIAELLGKASL